MAVRGNADGAYQPSRRHRRPSAMRPWTSQHDGLKRYKATHAVSQVVVGVVSRFYRLLAPPESPPADQRLRRSRRDSGLPPSAMRPCAPSRRAAGSTDGHGRRGRSGVQTVRRSGMAAVLRRRLAAELPLQAAGSLLASPSSPRPDSGSVLRTFTSSAAMYEYTVRLTGQLAMLSARQIGLAHVERAQIGNAGRSPAACPNSRRRHTAHACSTGPGRPSSAPRQAQPVMVACKTGQVQSG